jgi:hypothetical protein
MASSAMSISSLNANAADGLRSAYQRAAASASRRASSRYSSARATSRGRVDPTTRFRPANGLRETGVDLVEPGSNFRGPRSFDVGVDFSVEALDQFAGNGSTLLRRQTQRLQKDVS